MADPTLTKNLLILLGDGADPEVFGWPCGSTSRSVTLTNNTGEDVVMDCTDPMGVTAVVTRWTESQDTALTVSGRVSTESFATWRAWSESGAAKNIRITIQESAANGGGHYQLPAILTSFEFGAEGKATMTFTASIVAAGRRTWTAAS